MTKLLTIEIGPKCVEAHGSPGAAIDELVERIRKTLQVQMGRHADRTFAIVVEEVRKAVGEGELTTFMVNGDGKVANVGDVVTYADICTLAEHEPGMYPTVVVRRRGTSGGTVRTGQIVTIQGGEVFSVAYTGSA